MALYINDKCTECGACEWKCPSRAIVILGSEGHHAIVPARCTECVGDFCEPRCVAACSAGAIVPDPSRREPSRALVAKFLRLHPHREPVLF